MEEAIDSAVAQIVSNNTGKRIFLYGTGTRGRFCIHAFSKLGIPCAAFMESHADGQSRLFGIPILSPYDLMHENPSSIFILVAIQNPAPAIEILKGMGFREKEHFECIFDDSVDDGTAHAPHYNVLDFMLGYASQTRPKGYSTLHSTRLNPIKILALGGSTTDPDVMDPLEWRNIEQRHLAEGSWPRQLFEICDKANLPVTIINGGTVGYSSAQELLKLIRDGIQQRPDMVIVLSGLNDACGKYWAHNCHAKYHNHLSVLEDFIFKTLKQNPSSLQVKEPKSSQDIDQITFGMECTHSRAVEWHNNHRMMASICTEFGINYYAFLQPYGMHDPEYVKQPGVEFRLGWFLHNFFHCVAHNIITYKELADINRNNLIQYFIDQVFSYDIDHDNHFGIRYPAMEAFYREIQEERYKNDCIIPIVDALYAYPDAFHDTAHCTTKGNRRLAERIFRELQARDAFTPYSVACNEEGLR